MRKLASVVKVSALSLASATAAMSLAGALAITVGATLAFATSAAGCGGDNGGTDSDGADGDTDGADADDADGSDADGADADGADADGSDADSADGGDGELVLPPVNAPVDYQLGGAYTPPAGVMIVSRDRTETPAAGLYNICYVNGFQIQPNEEAEWLTDHADLILRDGNGEPVIDADWDEMLIDVGTPEKRTAVAAIVGGWISGCEAAGFDAIEIDNLDSFSRSNGLLQEADAVAAMRLFADAAHALGLPISQKNSAELVGNKAAMATDFVVAEECNTYDECDVYTDAYGDHVIVIEYVRADFDEGCANFPGLSIVYRDRDLVAPGSGGYVFDGC